jgi:hypothetical protein
MSPLFTYNGKLLVVDGKLATNQNCCCEPPGGFCCYCSGPGYSYSADNYLLILKPFAGIIPQFGWECIAVWFNEEEQFFIFLPGGVEGPPNFEFQNMTCQTGLFRCRYVEALENNTLGTGINGVNDELFGTTDWAVSTGKFHSCSENLSKEECEQCRDVKDLETAQDFCGVFTPKKDKPNSQCCFPAPEYNPNDGQNCICPVNNLP